MKSLFFICCTLVVLLNTATLASENPLAALVTISDQPQLLAPGFINTGLATRDVTMTPDGREIYFCTNTSGYSHAFILVTRYVDGAWTDPEVTSFSGHPGFMDLEPAISPDGQQLFFYSTRPVTDGAQEAQDIWVVQRQGDHWGEPSNLGFPVNTEASEFFPSVTADGTLYFCRADPATRRHAIFRSRLVDGQYAKPEKLPAEVNSGASQFNAWVSPLEDRLIVPVAGHPDNLGGVDYWLCRRNADDSWHTPVNLGPTVNDGSGQSWSPYISPDGENFFFMSSRTVGPPISLPVSWSQLQHRHRTPGSGRPGIFVMKASFLDHLDQEAMVSETRPPVSAMNSVPYPDTAGRYWGQELPGLDPEIFAPGILSTGLRERDICLSPDGRFLLYGVMDLGLASVMLCQWTGESWTEPITAPWHRDDDFACIEPALSADGKTVYFQSTKAAPGQVQGRGWATQNIYRSNWQDEAWSEAEVLPAPITTDAAEYFPSLAADGTLYFSREDTLGGVAIWMAKPDGNGYHLPTRLPAEVNVSNNCYNAFVSSDQRLIILCVADHEENMGAADFWISVRPSGGTWTPAQNMGTTFNSSQSRAISASLSPDEKILFFSSNRKIETHGEKDKRMTRQDLLEIHTQPGMGSSNLWWVDAAVLTDFEH